MQLYNWATGVIAYTISVYSELQIHIDTSHEAVIINLLFVAEEMPSYRKQ